LLVALFQAYVEEDWVQKEKQDRNLLPFPNLTVPQSVGDADACFFGSFDFVAGSA
jgi:hypothetical protein